MGQVLTTPYTWGLRLNIFWDTQTHRYTDTHTGFLFKIPVLAWASYFVLQFSPYYCYSVHLSIAVLLTLSVRNLAVVIFFNC